MATQPDPFTVMRSRAYLRLLVAAAVLGVPIAAAAYWFLQLVAVTQTWLYDDLPDVLGHPQAPLWWPLLLLGVGGLLVGLTVRYLPGGGGHSPSDGLVAGSGPPGPSDLPGIAIAAFATLACGSVLGPEAPLIALGGGLAYLAVKTVQPGMPAQNGAVVGSTGSFAAISTLLGSPLPGAFLLMEASGLGGATATLVLVPGLLAAGVGALIFVGLDSLTGYGVFSLAVPDLPPVTQLHAIEFVWAVVVGLAAAPVCWAIQHGARVLRTYADRQPLLMTPLMGLTIAALAILYATVSDRPSDEVLFSGQSALPGLISQSADYSVGTLVLLVVCKGLAYVCALSSFRGGPVFPAMFVGAAGGVALSHLPGLPLVPAVAIGISAMTAGALKLPLTAVLLTTLFLGSDGIPVMPLAITASVVSYVMTVRLMPAPPTSTPAGQTGAVPPQAGAPASEPVG
jgi:H+/Cl- antiporter ClcA